MKLKSLVSAAALVASIGLATSAQAASVSLVLDKYATGSKTPVGYPTATFTELTGADAGEIQLDISLAGLTAGAFVSDFLFNFDGTASGLTFTRIGGTGPIASDITITKGNINNNGITKNTGDYDIQFAFETGNGGNSDRFAAGEFLSFNIDSSVALTAAMFNVFSSGTAQNNGPFKALAHIQGLTDGTSVTYGAKPNVAVPGPIAGAGLPVLMALGGLVWARRRKTAAVA